MRRWILAFVVTLVSLFALSTQVQAVNSSANPAPSCSSYQPVDTQFRRSGDSAWISGAQLSQLGVKPGDQVDVNCFAQNGASLLPGGYIEVRYPSGATARLSDSSELRRFTLPGETGTTVYTCKTNTMANCTNSDTLTVKAAPQPTPVATLKPTPQPDPTRRPNPTREPAPVRPVDQRSQCDNLKVVGGNDSLVPAKVTLRAAASDNKGSIQRYKFYFGDGKQEETDQVEIQHNYETSGSFLARVDIKDSQGNWKTSGSCEARVNVRSSSLESHKAACSDLFVTAGNNAQAPATVSFKITGYDNKGNLKKYKLDFGNGIVKEADGQTFEQRYETAGTYTVNAYVLDTTDNWRGGEDNCKKTVYIATKPLTTQPSTGMPTMFSLFGLSSGVAGLAIHNLKSRRLL